ncbi:hypothetical protein UK15_13310 [Streptomyces variegatus]|uniref:Uncharacterized protein n=1 Tax=Streptomyces variegatus TaxID=284040 RepID=A0A0M2GNP2_9ACTN|nr:hypothetical protein UK15_13310 [Streptomyces variegatus]
MLFEVELDLEGDELLVTQAAGRLRPLLARVVRRLGHAQHPAGELDPEVLVSLRRSITWWASSG